jgi:group I intron endonuclease
MSYKIYIVTHPDSSKLYIGQTSTSLELRLYRHITNSRNGGNTPVKDWIRSHIDREDEFEIQLIEETEDWVSAERFWIKWHRDNHTGRSLNLADGGQGSSGCVFTFSEEHRRKISEAKTGVTRPESFKRKMSRINSGSGNPMYGRTGEDAPNAKISDEQVRNLRVMYRNTDKFYYELADIFPLEKGQIGNIIRGEVRREAGGPIKGEDY